MPNIKRDKGITMIALILMVIIMLILVTVSVSIISGSDGVINKSKDVMTNAELESLKERIREEIKQEEIKAKLLGQEINDATIENIINKYPKQLTYNAQTESIYITEQEKTYVFIDVYSLTKK